MKKILLLPVVCLFLGFWSCQNPQPSNDKNQAQVAGNEQDAADTAEAPDPDKKVKMILDLDTGVDDAMALAYALGNPNIELIGITTVFGNVTRATSIKNNLDLLKLLGQEDIPVFAGADRPTNAEKAYETDQVIEEIHGRNGLGNVTLPASEKEVQEMDAIDFIIESADKYGKDLYLVATGPETNMKNLIEKDPDIGNKLGNIVVMGGDLMIKGNVSPVAEANIFNDPVAANSFFTSGVPITMVGLDVTHRTLWTKDDTQKWRDLGTEAGKNYADIVDHYIEWEVSHQPELTGCALHDPLAVAVAVHPEYIKTLSLPMQVGTSDEDLGRTYAITEELNNEEAKTVKVAVDVEVSDFIDDFRKTLTDLFAQH